MRQIPKILCGMIADTLLGWAIYWYIRADEEIIATYACSIIKHQAKNGWNAQRGGVG